MGANSFVLKFAHIVSHLKKGYNCYQDQDPSFRRDPRFLTRLSLRGGVRTGKPCFLVFFIIGYVYTKHNKNLAQNDKFASIQWVIVYTKYTVHGRKMVARDRENRIKRTKINKNGKSENDLVFRGKSVKLWVFFVDDD